MNILEQKPKKLETLITDWDNLMLPPYNKDETDPYTKLRIILTNGNEFEQNWFMHNMSRHTDNNDLRRDIALLRRLEQQQQKKISGLKPINESLLETTIAYEQLAVDLTAQLAQNEVDVNVKAQLDFALLEDFDHLYRYADMLEMDQGIRAERLVGKYTEIMPGRPTISEHRHPFDDIRYHIDSKTAAPLTKLNVGIITAAEQQTMNYYMNIGQFYSNEIGRSVYTEIAMIEEQHVSGYGSLMDTNCTWLEGLVEHQWLECYLYYSCYKDETCEKTKMIWQQLFEEEVSHLHYAIELLQKYEKKDAQSVIGDGKLPKLLSLHSNIDYIRGVISSSARNTAELEKIVDLNEYNSNRFEIYQSKVNKNVNSVPTHKIIDKYIDKNGKDYRFEVAAHPIKELQDRTKDNTTFARK